MQTDEKYTKKNNVKIIPRNCWLKNVQNNADKQITKHLWQRKKHKPFQRENNKTNA